MHCLGYPMIALAIAATTVIFEEILDCLLTLSLRIQRSRFHGLALQAILLAEHRTCDHLQRSLASER